jgi:hypothetical protein
VSLLLIHIIWSLTTPAEVTRGSQSEQSVESAEQFLADTSENDVPAQLRDAIVLRGVVLQTVTVRTALVDFASYDVWRAYVYAEGDIHVIEVGDEHGAYEIAGRISPGDYIVVTTANADLLPSQYSADDVTVLQLGALQIPDEPTS